MNASLLLKRVTNRANRLWDESIVIAAWRLHSLLRTQNPYEQAAKIHLQESFSLLEHEYTQMSATDIWQKKRTELYQDILAGDIQNFLTWPVITSTMWCEPAREELIFLKKQKDWHNWQKILNETGVGNPKPYRWYLQSSGNSIHHAYSLKRFLSFSSREISEMRVIVEFGGGYGNLCRLVYAKGFTGQYIIFDLPEFSLLQEYYLTATMPEVSVMHIPTLEKKSVILLSSLEMLETQLQQAARPDLLVALWSLSESPIDLREKFLRLFNPRSYLIAYQAHFENIDNIIFFEQFKKTQGDTYWENSPIAHLKTGHYYLMGKNEI